jgi:sugar phosphate isomerase/epimerase
MHSNTRLSRRAFVLHSTTALAISTIGLPIKASFATSKYEMGLQLYTVRDPMAADATGTLKKIAALGYRNLETYGFDSKAINYYGMPARDFKNLLDGLNLITTSGHYDLNLYLNEPMSALQAYVDRCIEGARALNQSYITWPWLDPKSRDIASFKKLAERLNIIGAQIAKAGLKLAYHNHDFEFIPHNGQIGYDIVMNETDPTLVKLQLDLFWAAHSSKRTPHELFKLQPGRFVMWHIKDMDKRDRNLYTELGNGTIDFTKIMPDASLAGLEHYFVEQGDNFTVDPMTSIATSAQYVKSHLD